MKPDHLLVTSNNIPFLSTGMGSDHKVYGKTDA